MSDYTSHEALRALQHTVLQRITRDSRLILARLAEVFIKDLASNSGRDLGKDWLLHRLHSILIEQHPLSPGEIGVLRASISEWVQVSSFSEDEKELFTDRIETVLISLTGGQARSSTNGFAVRK